MRDLESRQWVIAEEVHCVVCEGCFITPNGITPNDRHSVTINREIPCVACGSIEMPWGIDSNISDELTGKVDTAIVVTTCPNCGASNNLADAVAKRQVELMQESDQCKFEQVRAFLRSCYANQRQNRCAKRRAKESLFRLLSSTQRTSWFVHGWFDVIGSNGGRYRIEQGFAGNIKLINVVSKTQVSLCCHAGENLPAEDHMLAQKLALETDESKFLETANETRYTLEYDGLPPDWKIPEEYHYLKSYEVSNQRHVIRPRKVKKWHRFQNSDPTPENRRMLMLRMRHFTNQRRTIDTTRRARSLGYRRVNFDMDTAVRLPNYARRLHAARVMGLQVGQRPRVQSVWPEIRHVAPYYTEFDLRLMAAKDYAMDHADGDEEDD